jgi:hypothetical protein
LNASRKTTRFRPAAAGILAVVAAATCGSATAVAKAPLSTALCPSASALSQPFLSTGDSNWYSLVDGQTVDNFDGSGWTLSDGAGVVPNDGGGSAANVLDIPAGSTAVSPPTCVTADYPFARTMLRNVRGKQGVRVRVSYLTDDGSWDEPKNAGILDTESSDWIASDPMRLKPDRSDADLQTMRFTLEARGKASDFQLYNLYVDPRMK